MWVPSSSHEKFLWRTGLHVNLEFLVVGKKKREIIRWHDASKELSGFKRKLLYNRQLLEKICDLEQSWFGNIRKVRN